jgi:hypothetical protein
MATYGRDRWNQVVLYPATGHFHSEISGMSLPKRAM